jgi:hypothetical protein
MNLYGLYNEFWGKGNNIPFILKAGQPTAMAGLKNSVRTGAQQLFGMFLKR